MCTIKEVVCVQLAKDGVKCIPIFFLHVFYLAFLAFFESYAKTFYGRTTHTHKLFFALFTVVLGLR